MNANTDTKTIANQSPVKGLTPSSKKLERATDYIMSMSSMAKTAEDLPTSLKFGKRRLPANPSLKEFIATATKRRRTNPGTETRAVAHSEPSKTSLQYSSVSEKRPMPAFLSLYDESNQHVPTPKLPSRRPRYQRRCSITKFSLEQTARKAVEELIQERRPIMKFDTSSARMTSFQHSKIITPILDSAIEELSSSP